MWIIYHEKCFSNAFPLMILKFSLSNKSPFRWIFNRKKTLNSLSNQSFFINFIKNSWKIKILFKKYNKINSNGGRSCCNENLIFCSANHLLAALAFSDMSVFFFMLPTSFAAFPTFYTNNSFRIFFATVKIHLAAAANWFSCAAIWYINFYF